MGKKTKGQEEIREKVALLLGAEKPLEKIIESLNWAAQVCRGEFFQLWEVANFMMMLRPLLFHF